MAKCSRCHGTIYKVYIKPRTKEKLCRGCATSLCAFCGKRVERWYMVFLVPHIAVCFGCGNQDGQRYTDYCKQRGTRNDFHTTFGKILNEKGNTKGFTLRGQL